MLSTDYGWLQNAHSEQEEVDITIPSSGAASSAIWNPVGRAVVTRLYGSLYFPGDTTGNNADIQFHLLIGSVSKVIQTFGKNIPAGQHVRVDWIPPSGWAGTNVTDNVFMQIPGGYSGDIEFSGFIYGRIER